MKNTRTRWLSTHKRDQIAGYDARDLAENVLSLRPSLTSAANPGEVVLSLVCQLAERIREAGNYAAEREARAETLAKQAIQKLKDANDRIRAAEIRRLAAEAEVEKLKVRVGEVEKVVEASVFRMSAVEAELSDAEQRTRAAETRANQAEKALNCIEQALSGGALKQLFGDSTRVAAAA